MSVEDLLKEYKHGSFVIKPGDNFSSQCNARKDESGVYIVYGHKKGTKELLYVGSSGQLKDNVLKPRSDGIRGRLCSGKIVVDGIKQPRHRVWSKKMLDEGYTALDIHWYVTYDVNKKCPVEIETLVYDFCVVSLGHSPEWNLRRPQMH